MRPERIAALILEGHVSDKEEILELHGFKLSLQLNYSGLMAKGAYEKWKRKRNIDRAKVGCFDFKIFRTDGENDFPVNHQKTLKKIGMSCYITVFEEVFKGKDPQELGVKGEELMVAQEVQLEMLEQEINWGDGTFQSWSHFLPSKGKRPRDFIMAYVRRLYKEPGFLSTIDRMRAASGTFGTLPPPLGGEWRHYLEPRGSAEMPWLRDKLLSDFKDAADAMPDNPNYRNAVLSGARGSPDHRR